MDQQNPPLSGGIAPYLTIRDGRAAEAVDFYKRAFGAEEVDRKPAQNPAKLMHAHLRINGGSLLLSDDFPSTWAGAKPPRRPRSRCTFRSMTPMPGGRAPWAPGRR